LETLRTALAAVSVKADDATHEVWAFERNVEEYKPHARL
jgi:uncharacterized protein (DUF2164 family)